MSGETRRQSYMSGMSGDVRKLCDASGMSDYVLQMAFMYLE